MMQQGGHRRGDESIIVVHRAISWTEAVVVRGLLESAGIPSPVLGDNNPYPMPELMTAAPYKGVEIYALESQAEQARRVIAEYLNAAGGEIGGREDEDAKNGA